MATKEERRKTFQASRQQQQANGPVAEGASSGATQTNGSLQQQQQQGAAKPELTKAERRAKQEAQRAAKQSNQQSGGAPKGQDKENAQPTKKSSSSHQQQGQGNKSSKGQSEGQPQPAASTSAQQSANQSSQGQYSMQLFTHLLSPPLHAKSKHDNLLHPSIARLALSWSNLSIVGTNARAISMLVAFQDILRSYSCPEGSVLARHLPTTYLSPQIECLYRARMRSLTLGNAIRWFKAQIAECRELSEPEAKDYLISAIDGFIRERIILADHIIVKLALEKITDGQVVLTYGRSSVVERILLEAKRQGKRFSVVVADSQPMLEGKRMLASLTRASIDCTYILISALGPLLPRVSLVLLGTHALLSNGSMFSRSGTATVALLSSNAGKPVVCCCETYKFSDKVMLDSIGGNELLPIQLSGRDSKKVDADQTQASLMYDVSRPEDVAVVISEAGLIPTKSVPAVMKDFKPLS